MGMLTWMPNIDKELKEFKTELRSIRELLEKLLEVQMQERQRQNA
jgi:hypothetical protein